MFTCTRCRRKLRECLPPTRPLQEKKRWIIPKPVVLISPLALRKTSLRTGATLLGQGDIAGKDCVLRFKRDGRMLAIASIFRDHESLQAELSMERGIAQADQRNA
jgi:hypothetical protein